MKSRLLAFLLLALSTAAFGQGYKQALPGYHYQFPKDNFSHPEYQTEWWYYTGNLLGKDGHRFGFELTFFRQGVSQQQGTSPWYVHDLYMAHLALTDIDGRQYYATERINRAGPGIAGADSGTHTIWNGNWQTQIEDTSHTLRGVGDKFSFDLIATPQKKLVIHGVDGVSQKAEGAGHASHYLSYTRMQTTGSLELEGKRYEVVGDTWMDHEFFSDSMQSDEVGWDWLSIQLNDNTELMLYRLRHRDGSTDPYSSGTYVDSQGNTTHLRLQDFQMVQSGVTWKSPTTAAVYPVAWSVQIPELKLQLAITTPVDNQEFVSRVGPSYWEGSINITGTHASQAIRGVGYLEMTGYSRSNGSFFPTSPR